MPVQICWPTGWEHSANAVSVTTVPTNVPFERGWIAIWPPLKAQTPSMSVLALAEPTPMASSDAAVTTSISTVRRKPLRGTSMSTPLIVTTT